MTLVETSVEDGVGVITFNRPDKRNALSDDMVEAWRAAVGWAAADKRVRAVLVRAEGPSFCAGRDTTQFGERPGGESDWSFVREHQRDALSRLRMDKPFVAAVNGAAVGGRSRARSVRGHPDRGRGCDVLLPGGAVRGDP